MNDYDKTILILVIVLLVIIIGLVIYAKVLQM